MPLPIAAIVGRPNVGKSSLLNSLMGKMISIVDAQAGVTRDRISAPLPLGEGYIELVDTGGFGIDDPDNLTEHVETQIRYAVAEAQLILFVVDALTGVLPLDQRVAELLRRQDRPVILVANKADNEMLAGQAQEFRTLGFGEPTAVSAIHGLGRPELLERMLEVLGGKVEQMSEPVMKLAIVGKRNAGKSTFINALAGQERVIVSETPGTTRDSVDVRFKMGEREFVAIDTAGVRKKGKMQNLEYYGFHRAQRSIRRADVVLLMIDAAEPIGVVDKQLARYILEQFKPVVLLVNKWDLATGRATVEDYQEYLEETLPHMPFAPISFSAAREGLNVFQTVDLAERLFQQASHRVGTGELNQAVEAILAQRGPSHKSGTKRPKLYYATQVATCPPTIVCFVNSVESFESSYQRYLVDQLRQRLPFPEIPLRLLFRSHRGTPQE